MISMSKQVEIGTLSFGTRIIAPHAPEGTVIGRHKPTDSMCIGFDSRPSDGVAVYPTDSSSGIERWNNEPPSFNMIDNVISFPYYMWVYPNVLVEVFEIIVKADQTCVGCKLPAPHSKPNVGNNFVCEMCKTIEELT